MIFTPYKKGSLKRLPFLCYDNNLCFCFRFNRNNASVLTSFVATFLESYYTVYQCVKSVIATHTYILTRVVNCTTLTNDYVTSDASLTTKNLNA